MDITFGGGDGIVTTEFYNSAGTYEQQVNATAVDNNGNIIAVGTGGSIVRYTSAGSLDNTFSDDGIALFSGVAQSVAIQSDGEIVVALR